MATPEAKVKQKVRLLLEGCGAYHFMPIGGPYSEQGTPDIICCVSGRFVGIECKANGNGATSLQRLALLGISESGGVAVLVDETGLDMLKKVLDDIAVEGSAVGTLYDLTKVKGE